MFGNNVSSIAGDDDNLYYPPTLPVPVWPLLQIPVRCLNDFCHSLNHCICSSNPINPPNLVSPIAELKPMQEETHDSDEEESILSTKCEAGSESEQSSESASQTSTGASSSSSSSEEKVVVLPSERYRSSPPQIVLTEEEEAIRRNKRRHTNIATSYVANESFKNLVKQGLFRKRNKAKPKFTKDEYFIEAHQSYRAKIHTKLFHIDNSLIKRHACRSATAVSRIRSEATGKFLPGKTSKVADQPKTKKRR
jgi:hypothetical protein